MIYILTISHSRNTIGLYIAAYPCGVIPDFAGEYYSYFMLGPKTLTSPELYGSESIRQVCATIVDFLGDIPEETRNRIVGWLYDDMCHLKPYSEKPENQLGAMGKLFAGMKKAVDKLHFR